MNYIATLTEQLEDLAWLIQGMSTAHRSNLSPRVNTSASFGTAGPLRDIGMIVRNSVFVSDWNKPKTISRSANVCVVLFHSHLDSFQNEIKTFSIN